jgi:hypothetical protein
MDWLAQNPDYTLSWFEQAENNFEKSSFTRSIRADKREKIA